MRGLIAVVAITICCLADPLTPWTNLQSVNPPQQGNDADLAQYEYGMAYFRSSGGTN